MCGVFFVVFTCVHVWCIFFNDFVVCSCVVCFSVVFTCGKAMEPKSKDVLKSCFTIWHLLHESFCKEWANPPYVCNQGFRCQKRFGSFPACCPTISLSFSRNKKISNLKRLATRRSLHPPESDHFFQCPGQAERLPPGLYKYRFFFEHLKSGALQTSFPLESREKSCSRDRLRGSSPCGSGTCSGSGATGLFDSTHIQIHGENDLGHLSCIGLGPHQHSPLPVWIAAKQLFLLDSRR